MSKKEKKALNLLKRGKFADAIDEYNLQAQSFEKAGDLESAIELCEKGSDIAREHQLFYEGSFSERQLSQLHAQLGNREPCLQHLVVFRKWSQKCGNRSQEQLSYHVEAWCLQQLYNNGAAALSDLERAIERAETSRKLVEQYKHTFKEYDTGGTPRVRKADLLILEAQLYNNLGNNVKSMELLETADRFLNANDKTMRYEVRRNQCSMAPVSRRLDIAELMEEEAPEEKKAQALIELSHLQIVSNRLKAGYQKLAAAYIGHLKQLAPSEVEEVKKRLSILYRLVKYTKILKNPASEAKISLCQLHESIGDLYDKYYQTMLEKERKDYRNFVKENILKNYEMMISHKRNDCDVLRSYLAMALVLGDLEEHSKALDLFEKRLELLERTGAAEEIVIDTRISLFNCQCKLKNSDVQRTFDTLKGRVSLPHHKKELFETWAAYWEEENHRQEAEKWRQMCEEIPDVVVKNEDDETDVLFGRLTEDDVLEKVIAENELLKLENMTEYKLTKKNDKGETRLHLAAQESDAAVVEKLCRMGCDVNARDNGGWTPLSEAVAHDELENVRVLIRYGADVNTRSLESFVSNESSQESASQERTRLTPLMEACANGFVGIARLLIENKASIELKDSQGWTAYQHLRHHIEEKGCSEEQRQFMEYLKKEMEKQHVPIRIPIVPAVSKKLAETRRSRNFQQELGDSPPDEEEEQIILDSAASRKRRFSPALSESSLNVNVKRPARAADVFLRSAQKRGTPPPGPPRRSFSPKRARASISPVNTIRSAPSVIDEDIQYLGDKKAKSPRVSNSPRLAVSVPKKPTISVAPRSDQIPVKCIFEVPVGAERVNPVMLPFNRTLTIGEAKQRATVSIKHTHWKMGSVWKNGDEDKCLLSDELQLCHVDNGSLELVFQLTAPPACEIYKQIAKVPIPEVIDRFERLETDNSMNLTDVFIEESEMIEVTKALSMCHRPDKIRLSFGCADFTPENETHIRLILDGKCRSLTLENCTGFLNIFQNRKFPLEELEVTACDFRDEAKIIKMLESFPHLKSLKLAAVRVENPSTSSGFAEAVGKMSDLKRVDLSFNDWISDDDWKTILTKIGEQLEELTIKDSHCDFEFESYWLSSLRKLSAVGSTLHFDSLMEALSILEDIEQVDVRFSNCDPDVAGELRKNKNLDITF